MNDVIYTCPSGIEFKAQLRSWSDSFIHVSPSFPIINGLGDIHQDNGVSSSNIPIRFEFKDFDESNVFYDCIREIGPGTLTEPDSNKTRGVQALRVEKTLGIVKDVSRVIYYVVFEDDVSIPIVESTESLRQTNNTLADDTTNLTATNFEGRQDITTTAESVKQQANFNKTLTDITTNLSVATTELENNIDLIVQDPINAMTSAKILMQTPGISYNRVKSKIEGYAQLVDNILDINDLGIIGSQNQLFNDAFYIQSMGSMALNAMANNVVDSSYKTKQEAFETANILVTSYNKYRDLLDSLSFYQDGSIQQSLVGLIYNTLGFLYQISFSLKTEFIFTSTKDLTIYEIAEEYYPDEWKDDEESIFNFVAETNSFTDNDFLYLRPGRKVIVYV